jgi:type II secretory pathway predicted ATPase ExeA
MDIGESSTYRRHRPALAGPGGPLVAHHAVARLHRVATGLFRALNNAATVALIAAATGNLDLVDDACTKQAAAELTRD